jgi:hemerythrin superfamily protein
MLNRIFQRVSLALKILTRRRLDILDMLKADHLNVEMSYLLFRLSKDESEAQEMAQLIQDQLRKHTFAEENFFYPACENVPKLKKMIEEGYEEHKEIKLILDQLDTRWPASTELKGLIESLMAVVRHHVKEEEDEVFPQVRRLIGSAELQGITNQVHHAKEKRVLQKAA